MPFALIVPAAFLWLIGTFWGGFVAAKLWLWFMVGLGVVPITYWHAVGLSALIGVFLGSRGLDRDSDPTKYGEKIRYGFVCALLIPAMCLASGWVAHANM
jgi:hypothetical protein